PAGAYDQIRIGKARGIEPARERAFVDRRNVAQTRAHFFCQRTNRVADLAATAVIDREIEENPAIAGRLGDERLQRRSSARRQTFGAPTEPHAHAFSSEAPELAARGARTEPHQQIDFDGGPLPVL